jgi:hypothetical protein
MKHKQSNTREFTIGYIIGVCATLFVITIAYYFTTHSVNHAPQITAVCAGALLG